VQSQRFIYTTIRTPFLYALSENPFRQISKRRTLATVSGASEGEQNRWIWQMSDELREVVRSDSLLTQVLLGVIIMTET
jgi:hypothetical protein